MNIYRFHSLHQINGWTVVDNINSHTLDNALQLFISTIQIEMNKFSSFFFYLLRNTRTHKKAESKISHKTEYYYIFHDLSKDNLLYTCLWNPSSFTFRISIDILINTCLTWFGYGTLLTECGIERYFTATFSRTRVKHFFIVQLNPLETYWIGAG